MNKTTQRFLFLGSILMALAVCLGAFGAHILKKVISPDMLVIYQTGVQYQFYHALGLFVVAFVAYLQNSKAVKIAGNLMFLGIVLFSGSLYLYVFLNVKFTGPITPIGGVLMVVSWLILAWSVLKTNSKIGD